MTKDELIEIKDLALKSNFVPSGYVTPGGEELLMVGAQKVILLIQQLKKAGLINEGDNLPGNIALVQVPHCDAYFLLFTK